MVSEWAKETWLTRRRRELARRHTSQHNITSPSQHLAFVLDPTQMHASDATLIVSLAFVLSYGFNYGETTTTTPLSHHESSKRDKKTNVALFVYLHEHKKNSRPKSTVSLHPRAEWWWWSMVIRCPSFLVACRELSASEARMTSPNNN